MQTVSCLHTKRFSCVRVNATQTASNRFSLNRFRTCKRGLKILSGASYATLIAFISELHCCIALDTGEFTNSAACTQERIHHFEGEVDIAVQNRPQAPTNTHYLAYTHTTHNTHTHTHTHTHTMSALYSAGLVVLLVISLLLPVEHVCVHGCMHACVVHVCVCVQGVLLRYTSALQLCAILMPVLLTVRTSLLPCLSVYMCGDDYDFHSKPSLYLSREYKKKLYTATDG